MDFIFSREGLTEENGVMSLNEHDDSLENVTTVKQVARVFRDLTAQLRAEAAEVPRATDLLYISKVLRYGTC